MLRKYSKTQSSRRQIRIKEVKDRVLVLPNEQYRAIIETSSVNFELKSEEEQDIIIKTFQNFLNSLPCPLQLVIRIREIDIDAYLELIAKTLKHEKEDVYRKQIKNYSSFIKEMVSGNKILSRRFYIVVPYHNAENQDFDFVKEQLNLRLNIIEKGLEKIGMKSRELDNVEIPNLFYRFYNPKKSKIQELTPKSHVFLTNSLYG